MQGASRLSPEIAFLYPRSHQGKGNLPRVGNHRIQKGAGGHSIVREYHRKSVPKIRRIYFLITIYSPCNHNVGDRVELTLIGASNSNNMGCEMKISLALVQR